MLSFSCRRFSYLHDLSASVESEKAFVASGQYLGDWYKAGLNGLQEREGSAAMGFAVGSAQLWAWASEAWAKGFARASEKQEAGRFTF